MSWTDEPLLDPEQFGGYADLLPPEQMAALVTAYRRELATRPDELAELLARGDLASVKVAAHRLKGASLTIGARRLAMLADAIEAAGEPELPALAKALAACAVETSGAVAAAFTR